MASSDAAKGKKRASADSQPSLSKRSSSSLSPVTSDSEADSLAPIPKTKRPKRAETRKCPVCDELIPLRLLSKHALLEEERVNGIIQQIGSTESVESLDEFQVADGPGPSARRSALRARKSLRSSSSSADSVEQANKVIQVIKRHRKQRHARLRELTRDLDDEATSSGTGSSRDSFVRRRATGEIQCPVCMMNIRGDEDVLEAHIDACLADQARRIEERTEVHREWDDMDTTEGVGYVGDVTGAGKYDSIWGEANISTGIGTGFHTRNPDDQDVEDDVDIDGDDQAIYGEAQFTEGDVISLTRSRSSDDMDDGVDIEIDGESESEDESHDEQKTLHDLVAEGKLIKRVNSTDGVEAVRAKMNEVMGMGDIERIDIAIATAQTKGDRAALINALENKIALLVGIHARCIYNFVALSNLPGSLYRTHGVHGVLAHLLPRMLATVPRVNQVMPNLQAHHRRH
ncbi:hypothetical protein AX15_007276 [Amanita polypyramis BW_CC]|nr:hypothetical protein AX15_007276 [Amanita polypyramis BW_CC]